MLFSTLIILDKEQKLGEASELRKLNLICNNKMISMHPSNKKECTIIQQENTIYTWLSSVPTSTPEEEQSTTTYKDCNSQAFFYRPVTSTSVKAHE